MCAVFAPRFTNNIFRRNALATPPTLVWLNNKKSAGKTSGALFWPTGRSQRFDNAAEILPTLANIPAEFTQLTVFEKGEKMKIYLSGDLKSSLSTVAKFVGGRNDVPSARSLLMNAERKGLRVTATDLKVGIRSVFPAQVPSEGTALVPPNIVDLIAGAQKVSIRKNGDYDLDVRTEAYSGMLKGLPVEEYPEEPDIEDHVINLPKKVFGEILNVAGFAGGTLKFMKISWRPLTDNQVRVSAIATDGLIAGIYTNDISGSIEEGSLVIPAESVRVFEALSTLSSSQNIRLGRSTGNLIASDGNSSAWACLNNGSFPNVVQAFQNFGNPAGAGILKLKELEFGASKMLVLLAGDKSTAGMMRFSPEEVLMMSQETELGSGQFSIPFVESSLTEDVTIGVNFELIRRVTGIFLSLTEQKESGSVQAAVTDHRSPIIYKMQTAGGGRLVSLTMPLYQKDKKSKNEP